MKKQNRNALLALSVVGSIALVACGGGGSSPDTSPDTSYDTSYDTTAPVVTLIGEKSITFEQFSASYEELGATASDETDGSVSVRISGNVNPEIPNVYTITYEAYDNAGNRGVAKRYVTVTAPPEDTNKTRIDVLAVYSNGADALYEGDIETRLVQIIALTNQIHNASKTGVEVVLVHSEQTDKINDVDLMSVNMSRVRTDAGIAQIRDNVKADGMLVYQLFNETENVCGRGYLNIPLEPEYAVSVVGIECATSDTTHELGHNMGNGHSHLQNEVGIFPYSTGHLVQNDFGTIMTYSEQFRATEKYVFSNPDLECNGQPCGIEAGEVGEADASKTIRETKTAISEFRLRDGETPAPKAGDQTLEISLPVTSYGAVATIIPPSADFSDYAFMYSSTSYGNHSQDSHFVVLDTGEIYMTSTGERYFDQNDTITEVSYLVGGFAQQRRVTFTITLKFIRI